MNKFLKAGLIFGGCALSFGFGTKFQKRRANGKTLHCGSLRIDRTEEYEPPKLFLELDVPIETLQGIDVAQLLVVNQNYIYANKTTPIMKENKLKGE